MLVIAVKLPNATNGVVGPKLTGNGLMPLYPAPGVDHGSLKTGLRTVVLEPKGGMIDVHRWYCAFG